MTYVTKTVRAVLAVALATTGLVLGSAGGAQAAGPRVTANPYNGLVGGATVTVRGTGLPPHTTVNLVECDISTAPDEDGVMQGCPVLGTPTTDGTGKAVATLSAVDPVYRSQEFGDPVPIYCRADVCRYFMEWTDASGFHSVGTNQLHFVGSPATIAASPATGLTDGQTVHVSGSAKGSHGRYVTIVEASCFAIIQGSGCNGAFPLVSLKLDSHQNYSGNVTVFRYLADGEDCVGNFYGCQLSVTVLDETGEPDDSFGVSRIGQPGVSIDFAG